MTLSFLVNGKDADGSKETSKCSLSLDNTSRASVYKDLSLISSLVCHNKSLYKPKIRLSRVCMKWGPEFHNYESQMIAVYSLSFQEPLAKNADEIQLLNYVLKFVVRLVV